MVVARGPILPKVGCGLCGAAVDLLKPFFRTTGVFLPAQDPLIRFCNAPLHWECYARWPERPRFAKRYVEAWAKANRKNPFWWTVCRDERVYVAVNPVKPVEEASVRLCAVGSDIRVPLPRWTEWLATPKQVTPQLQPLEDQELAAVLPELRRRFPDDHAVVDSIDPGEKQP